MSRICQGHVLRVQGLKAAFRQGRACELEERRRQPSKGDAPVPQSPRPAPKRKLNHAP